MVELHGWFTIREAFREQDESDEVLADAISRIEKALENLNGINVFVRLLVQNGAHNLLINGNFNHSDSRWIEINELIQFVATVAPGSFGILHFHNDEDKTGRDNQFQAIVMKKGKIHTVVERNLSPVFGELEQ